MKFYETIFDNYDAGESIYSCKTMTAIADRKWKSFGRKVFIKDIIYVLILIIFYALIANILDYANNEDHGNMMTYVYLGIGAYIVGSEFIMEFGQMFLGGEGLKGVNRYFKNEKNLIDCYYIISWALFVGMNGLVILKECTIIKCPATFEWLFIIRSLASMAMCLRVIWLFQVNVQFGFMIRVIIYSTKKASFFFGVFILLIIGVVVSVGGLKYEKDDWVKALNLWIRYFFYTYKLALGDFGDFFQLQEDDDNSPKSRAIFIYFFLSTAILTIILLNLLISILGGAFEEVKDNEKNYIYSATHFGLYDIEKNYSLREDGFFAYNKKRPHLNFCFRLVFFFKFILFLIFRRKILTRYPNRGTYMIFACGVNDEEIKNLIVQNYDDRSSFDVEVSLKIKA